MQTSADDPGQNGTMVQSLGLLFFFGGWIILEVCRG